MERMLLRLVMVVIWVGLFFAYTVVFGNRLRSWDWEIPGRCYSARGLAAPENPHPAVDIAYVAITAFCSFLVLGLATLKRGPGSRRTHNNVLVFALVQVPLHLYFMWVIRRSNEKLLEKSGMEKEWGFGQIIAVMLLGCNLVTLISSWEKVRRPDFHQRYSLICC
jgi:hypothetical protein